MDLKPPPPTWRKIPGSAHESYLIAFFKQAYDQLSDLHKYPFSSWKRPHSNQTIHTVAILSEFNFKIFEPRKNAYSDTFIFSKEIMLTINPLTLWSQNVLIENFWSEMNFPQRIINSFQTSWKNHAKLSIRKLTLTSQTLYIYNSMT